MDIEENKSRQGNINSPPREEEIVVELNFDLMKNIQSLQEDLQSFKNENMNERREQKAISEALLRSLIGVNPHRHSTHSISKSKENCHHKRRTNSLREEGREENTLDFIDEEYQSSSSDGSPSPCKKRQKNDDNLQGEFRKIKAPTYEGETNTKEKDEECLLGMDKYFQVHNYSNEMKSQLAIYNLNGKAARWWRDLKHTKRDEVKDIRWSTFN